MKASVKNSLQTLKKGSFKKVELATQRADHPSLRRCRYSSKK
nr:MAG TPA: hypothetical protein [Siphoviridae sp. ctgbm9]